ncbi:hypothetical protein JW756_05345 [Candidatus Woesearchaeota archaeon]|nr:hypothetical protein [Candidatus Woesearchaeota archaeon]
MEQYWMPKRLDFKNLRLCIDNYKADFLFIRDCGGYNADGNYRMEGLTKVEEKLEGRTLDFSKDSSGLSFLIDNHEVFHLPLKDRGTRTGKGFSLAYERIHPTEDGIGRMVMLSHGVDPYDPKLPEPRRSFLRHIIDNHLVEIYFKGRIHLKFHSWWQEPHWKYWTTTKESPKKS